MQSAFNRPGIRLPGAVCDIVFMLFITSMTAAEAALAAGQTRLRPILMTSLAMVIGMLPMSLGLGDGGEQNAPLGRAVIGGLMMGTCATLFVVPWHYTRLRRRDSHMLEEYSNV